MSIIYEALKKADSELKGNPVDVKETKQHEDFVTAFKTLEARQKSAIHERIKTSIVPDRDGGKKVLHTIVIMTLLFTIASIVLYYFYLKGSIIFSQESQSSVATTPVVVAEHTAEREVVALQPKTRVAPVSRDVVVKPVVTSASRDVIRRRVDTRNAYYARSNDAEPLFVCSGIIIEPNERYCFLNGVIMRVGERLDGARVLSIDDREVVLEYRGKNISLLLPASKQRL